MRASFFELTCVLSALAERQRRQYEAARPAVMDDDQAADFFLGLAKATQRRERKRA